MKFHDKRTTNIEIAWLLDQNLHQHRSVAIWLARSSCHLKKPSTVYAYVPVWTTPSQRMASSSHSPPGKQATLPFKRTITMRDGRAYVGSSIGTAKRNHKNISLVYWMLWINHAISWNSWIIIWIVHEIFMKFHAIHEFYWNFIIIWIVREISWIIDE